MAYIKQISIKCEPKKMLEYIMNIDKTNGELVSGLNTLPKVNFANNTFKMVFNQYYDQRYGKVKWDYTNTSDKSHKYAVKIHHYVQSFEEGTITPEVAHQIGKEWAKKCFGEKAVVLMATHIDKGHVHNHFAVGSYTLDDEKLYSNKEMLQKCREVSDELCKTYGINLSIVEKTAENKRLGKKNTYIEDNYIRPQGRSWKAQIEKDIDELLPTVDTFEELLQGLEKMGYTVDTSGKYVKIKPQGKDRFVRLKSLSSGYDEETLKSKLFEQLKSRVIVDVNYEVNATVTTKPLRQLLKEDIDNAISKSVSYSDFLKLMQVDYTVKLGTYIDFRKDGYGQSFLRSKSIGAEYDEEHIRERIEQNNRQRKSEVVQEMSKALDDNVVSLSGLEQKQSQLKTKLETLDHKVEELSNLVSQYDELKSIESDYLRLNSMPVSNMTITDIVLKHKIDLILMQNGIQDSSEFISKLHEFETIKHNYDLIVKERNNASKEYQRYTKLIDDYHKVQEQSKAQQSLSKNSVRKKSR